IVYRTTPYTQLRSSAPSCFSLSTPSLPPLPSFPTRRSSDLSAPIPNSSAACTNWACRASCGPSTRRLGWNAPSTPEPTGSSRTPRIVSSRSSRPSESRVNTLGSAVGPRVPPATRGVYPATRVIPARLLARGPADCSRGDRSPARAGSARLLARGPGDVAQVGLPVRGVGDGEATAGDLLGEDADEMVLRPRLQRGHVEGESLLQILGRVDLLRVAPDDDAERGAVLGVDAVDLERHTGV